MERNYKQLEDVLKTTVVWLAESEYSDNLVAELAETAEMYNEATGCEKELEELLLKAEILRCLPLVIIYGILKEMIFKQMFLCRFMLDITCCTGFDRETESIELEKLINDTQVVFAETTRRWNDKNSKLYNDKLPKLPTIELLK